MDLILTKLEEIRPLINRLNDLQIENSGVSQNLIDLKALLPDFLKDLNQIDELVGQIEEQAKK